MNWLAKYGAPVLVILFFISCRTKDGQITVGTNYSTIGTNYTDSLSLKTYTVLCNDSVATSTRINYPGLSTLYTPYFQLGQYSDAAAGDLRAEIYTQLRLATENVDLSGVTSVADVDSAYLYIDYYGYSCGDTTVLQSLDVFEMTSALDPAGVYFSNSPAPSLGSSITDGPVTPFYVRAKTADPNTGLVLLKIPINKAWCYNILAAGGMTGDNFVANVLDGIAIVPAATDPSGTGAVFRVSLGSGNTRLVIYYAEGSSYTLTASTNGQGFTRITTDRSPTAYSSLVTKASMPASSTGEVTYIQAGIGVRTKIEIPYLSLFKQAVGDNVVINKALLVIPSASGSTTDHTPNAAVFLIRTDATNIFSRNSTGAIAFVQTSNYPQNVSGHDLIAGFDTTNKYFQADVTDFVRDMLNQRLPNTGFFVYPYNNGVLVNRTMLNSGSPMLTDRMQLKLYYTIKP